MKKRFSTVFKLTVLLVALAFVMNFACNTASAADKKYKVVILVKSMGNGFFNACADGAREAAKELGDVEVVYMGPPETTAEGQIDIIETLIAQKVDAIAISANDRNALIPVCRKAMKRGIKVISFDSGISKLGRIIDLVPSNVDLVGKQQVELIAKLMGGKGEFAIVSASSQATNQNLWIEAMGKELIDNPAYKDIKLLEVVYGDDSADKSYREAVGLFSKYPNLKGITSPTTVGLLACAKAIEDYKKQGKVELTGLGLPSEMKQYIENGVCKEMALWNPVDLGYTSTYICEALLTDKIKGKEGDVIDAGHMGKIKVGKDGVTVMGKPYVFDKNNVAKFAKIF